MSGYDIAQLVISILSLIATVAVSVIIYFLESKRDKQIDIGNENARIRNLEHEAEIFIIKNGDDIDYLPLCVFANNLNGTRKHKRAIYNNFNICSDELKKIILEKQKIYIKDLPSWNWFSQCITLFEDKIELLDLGRSLYYDDAKYIKYCFDFYGKNEVPDINDRLEFNDYDIKDENLISRGIFTCTLNMYLNHFFAFKNDSRCYKNPDNIIFPSPCDMIYDIAVGDDEQKYCFWMAHLMRYLCAHIRLTKNENSFYQNSYSQAIEINEQFFEDLYYCAVYELYITFGKNLQNNENEN